MAGLEQSWKDLVEAGERAKNKSISIRRKVAAICFMLRQPTMLPVFVESNFGWNHIPNNPEEPLEWVKGEHGVDYTQGELLQHNIDDLFSKPHVRHAEIHALMRLIGQPSESVNSIYTTASCCLDCAKQIVEYAPFIKNVFYSSDYSCDLGIDYLKNNGVNVFFLDIKRLAYKKV